MSHLRSVLSTGTLVAHLLQPALAQTTPRVPQGGDDPAVVYVANVGQWQHPADFVAQIGATTAFLTADGIRLAFVAPGSEPLRTVSARERLQAPRQARQGAAVDLRFVGARTVAPLADPTTIRSGRRNFFVGEQSTWRTEVPGYGAVTYPDLYAGVDVRCYALDGHFEYDVELAPGADLSAVVVELAGVDAVSLDGDGALQFATAAGFVRQPAPMAFVGSGADRRPTAAGFRLLGNNRFGFSVPGWDGEQALVIDPGLLYSAVFGGVPVSGGTIPYDTAQSATGVVTIVATPMDSPIRRRPARSSPPPPVAVTCSSRSSIRRCRPRSNTATRPTSAEPVGRTCRSSTSARPA